MALTLVTAPAVEPVSVADVKSHLRIDNTDDDTLLGTYIAVARRFCERYQNRAYITQTWKLVLDNWPKGHDVIELSYPPLQSVTNIVYYDTDETANTLSTSVYMVDTDSKPGRVTLKYNQTWPYTILRPYNGIEITYVAGYGDAASDVPENVVHAMKLLIGHLYENREATGIRPLSEIPFAVKSLLDLERIIKI